MDGSRVPLNVWAVAIELHLTGLSDPEFQSELVLISGISPSTARTLKARLVEGPLPLAATTVPAAPSPIAATPKEWTDSSAPTAAPARHPAAPAPDPSPVPSAPEVPARLSLPRAAVALAGGVALTLIALWAFPSLVDRSDSSAYARMHTYVGILSTDGGQSAHVSFVQGIQVQTPIPEIPNGEIQALARHMRIVDTIRQRIIHDPDYNEGIEQ